MNIALFRLRPLLKELRLLRLELVRMNDMREFEMATSGLHVIRPRVSAPDATGEDPTVSYVDEEADYLKELQEALGKTARKQESEAEGGDDSRFSG